MALSVFDLFKIGIGPSSSHTVGPMIAADRFVRALAADDALTFTTRVCVELFGSLGATGKGHGSIGAVALGLLAGISSPMRVVRYHSLIVTSVSDPLMVTAREHPRPHPRSARHRNRRPGGTCSASVPFHRPIR